MTRSPSWVSSRMNCFTASRARIAFAGVKCRSSNTITKVRPWRSFSSIAFVEIIGKNDSAAASASAWSPDSVSRVTSNASKVTTSCCFPSSKTWRFSGRRPRTGLPSPSVTTTSTTTCSTWPGKLREGSLSVGSCASGCGLCAIAHSGTNSRTAANGNDCCLTRTMARTSSCGRLPGTSDRAALRPLESPPKCGSTPRKGPVPRECHIPASVQRPARRSTASAPPAPGEAAFHHGSLIP